MIGLYTLVLILIGLVLGFWFHWYSTQHWKELAEKHNWDWQHEDFG